MARRKRAVEITRTLNRTLERVAIASIAAVATRAEATHVAFVAFTIFVVMVGVEELSRYWTRKSQADAIRSMAVEKARIRRLRRARDRRSGIDRRRGNQAGPGNDIKAIGAAHEFKQ